MPSQKHHSRKAVPLPPPRRIVKLDEASQILEQNIPPLIDAYTHASDDVVATKVVDAVKALLGRLVRDQRPGSRSEDIAPSSHVESSAPAPDPPSRKRRRREVHLSDHPETDDVVTIDQAQGREMTPGVTEVTKKTRRTRRPARSSTQSTPKPATVLAISRDCGPPELSAIRTTFESELLRLDPSPRRDGTLKPQEFTAAEAADLTTFFFDEVMGPVTLQRLIGLVKSYTPSEHSEGGEGGDDDQIDAGALVRLKNIAHDKHAPLVIRRFFGTFHHHQRLQNTNPVITHLQQIIDSRELLQNYERVRTSVDNGDQATLDYLAQRGMTVGVGRGWSTVAIDFLANEVQIKRSTFVNMCERAKGINTLVEHFGEGILPLLPPGSMHRLRRYGSQRMEQAYDVLKRHVQSFQPMCDLTKDYVYTPFMNGEPTLRLNVSHLTEPKSHNFIDIITDAVSEDPPSPRHEVEDVHSN